MIERSSGVLAHVTMLPGPYGCGTFGKKAEEFIDLLADCGFVYWQVLPLSHPESENSPYTAYSAFALNPLLADPGRLLEEGLLTEEEEKEARIEGQTYRVDYARVKETRSKTLHRAFARVTARTNKEIDAFVKDQPWVIDYARYLDAVKGSGDGARVRFYEFVQWVLDTQWQRVKKYANDKGVLIFGDMPIYLSGASADVWAHPEYFLLGRDGRPEAVAGVPPDYFSADGQLWGNPLYDYAAMEKDGYKWWISRIGKALRDYDAVRIDHFRGFSAFWAVPAGEQTARNGKWMKGPGMKLFKKVKEVYPDANIIAEDLGILDKAFYSFKKQAGYPGMKVLQFAFGPGGEAHLPHNYDEKVVAYTGTHDNNTMLGHFFSCSEEERSFAFRYVGLSPNDDWTKGGAYAPVVRACARTLWQSRAVLTVLPYQDLAGWGEDTRMNRPGVASGCWEVRITEESLRQLDRTYWRQINHDFERDGKKKKE